MENVFDCQAVPGETQRFVSADVAQGLPAAMLTDAQNRSLIAITLTIEGQGGIRVAFGGAVPTQWPNQVGHYFDANNLIIRVTGSTMLRSMQYISDLNGVPITFQITPEYETYK